MVGELGAAGAEGVTEWLILMSPAALFAASVMIVAASLIPITVSDMRKNTPPAQSRCIFRCVDWSRVGMGRG